MIQFSKGMCALFLEGSRGALLAVYYRPVGEGHPLGDVLVVPAFGEEMHRCRSMVSMQARELAKIGIGTLVLDPLGTGDSAGEFGEANWAIWQEDLRAGIRWLRVQGNGCRTLWGIRLGAIMAAELAVEDAGIERLLLWQPVVDGRQFLTQFLRIRIAAEIEQSGGAKSTDSLRNLAATAGSVDVSGYRLNGRLVQDLDNLRLPDSERLAHIEVSWCEVLPAADSNVQRANAKALEEWQQGGVKVKLARVVGPSFWQVHERATVPELLAVTTRFMLTHPGSSHAIANAVTTPISYGTAIAGGMMERPVIFRCGEDDLIGIVHSCNSEQSRAVIIVVAGGPQYRAGAHRQFVSLARKLADRGYPVLRFDLRGMGDSAGEHLGFQDSGPDIRSAIDALLLCEPKVKTVVLLGECESASGILFYAFRDPRVAGAVLVNPWVRTEGGRAEVVLKHYYFDRLTSPDFWRKIVSGKFNPFVAIGSLATTVKIYLEGQKVRSHMVRDVAEFSNLPLPMKTAEGLRRFHGPVLILMSGNDYIAREFDEAAKSSKAWAGLLNEPRVMRKDIADADHTFSREEWKRQAQDWVCDWLGSW